MTRGSHETTVQEALRNHHAGRSRAPVRAPSPEGLFPSNLFAGALPVVPDANRLRDDIGAACKRGMHTILLNAANVGYLRLFCARHVVDEVFEHAPRWAREQGIAEDAYLAAWRNWYLPLLHVVDDDAVPPSLLGKQEAERVAWLASRDADDAPSATLALVLRAFYLSGDRTPLRAVYGDLDRTLHHAWVSALASGGDVGALRELGHVGVAVAAMSGDGAMAAVQALGPAAAPVGVGAVLAGVLLWRRAADETRSRIGLGLRTGAEMLVELAGAYRTALTGFERVLPPAPSWDELGATIASDDVLARWCAQAAAHHPRSNVSAAELARLPTSTGVPRGAQRIRRVLRANRCFQQVGRGRWQLGTPDARRGGHADPLAGWPARHAPRGSDTSGAGRSERRPTP